MAGGIRGKTFVITGTFRSISRREATRRIQAAGGAVAGSVSNKTDALFAGDGGGSKTHQAQIRGVPILDEAALTAVLAGGDLDALIDKERPKPAPTLPDNALEQFTALDLAKPSEARWAQIATLLDQCGPELASVAVDYLTEATEAWDGDLDLARRYGRQPKSADVRRAPSAWVDEILRGQDHPKHGLVRVLDLSGLKLTGKVANHLFDCPHLANVRLLRLDNNSKLPAAFYKNLADAPLFANLTHLSLADTRLNKGHVAALASATHLRDVTHLSLDSARFDSAESLAALLAAPTWAKLQHLDYHYTRVDYDVSNAGLAALAANPAVAALQALRWQPRIDAGLLADLARKYAASLERLWLDDCDGADVIPALTATGLQRITHLTLGNTDLGGSGVAALVQHPALQHLEALTLSGVGGGDEGVDALAAATAMTGLRSLTLYDKSVSDGALAQLLATPQLRNVVELNLVETGFGPASADAICDAPLASLQRLNIYKTKATKAALTRITEPGALPALKGLITDIDLSAKVRKRYERWW